MGKRRWLWLLVPLVGAGAMLAMPPMDEYTELERVGARLDPVDLYLETYVAEQGASPDARERLRGVLRETDRMAGTQPRRAWQVRLPGGAAARETDRLFPSRLGWQRSSVFRFPREPSKKAWTVQSAIYANDQTGDRASVTHKATLGGDLLMVEVTQSQVSLRPWARIKRWAQLTFRR